jgi:hypothetical protein
MYIHIIVVTIGEDIQYYSRFKYTTTTMKSIVFITNTIKQSTTTPKEVIHMCIYIYIHIYIHIHT